ncbi:MAG TPA: translation elongation factor Ts [Brevefilum fermentans]|jgi:elongation factor Ts|uniref:Elongation factor Ts n=1 Tax=Candidatus Brevifilum fermentans TaxID=1986204 RepID=A0A1Y6K0B0_9CHLR|nr:translation elongation factor Ts [Brevefilum fermentans]MDI9565623.1 translation elongation factor Ts [Chloroflexota bacterium]OQB88032.1 MAG: Elongation factor Ts [Chloroflexi bacterium ADurb.Bin120]SMX53093.1 Elongation factor Ts [Brevefilum fermentans]HOM67442.1 translation elongation factor Ts [Brevefilum fermentans]HPX95111.1 translation elongation factor Ts [Brevefilum fermentans]
MEITTEMIKELRKATGCGILDCRAALRDADGDFDKAVIVLREKGLAKAAKRANQEAAEGVIEVYSHGEGRLKVMVEVNCETDFASLSPDFRELAHEIALHIAAANPLYLNEEDIPQADLDREAHIATVRAKDEGKPEHIIPKIVEGFLKKFKQQTVLVNQAYVRDESMTVQDLINQTVSKLGEKIVVRRFVRWELGSASDPVEQGQDQDQE